MKFLDFEIKDNSLLTEEVVKNWENVFTSNNGTVTDVATTGDKLFYIQDKAIGDNWVLAWVLSNGNLYQFGPVTKPFLLDETADTFMARYGIKIEKIDEAVDNANNKVEEPVEDHSHDNEDKEKSPEVAEDHSHDNEAKGDAPVEDHSHDNEQKASDSAEDHSHDNEDKEKEGEAPKADTPSEEEHKTEEKPEETKEEEKKEEVDDKHPDIKDTDDGIKEVVKDAVVDNPTGDNVLPAVPEKEKVVTDETGNNVYENPSVENPTVPGVSYPKLHGVEITKAFGQELDDSEEGKTTRMVVDHFVKELEDEEYKEYLNGNLRVYSLIASASKKLTGEEAETFLTVLENYFVSPEKHFIEFGDKVEIPGMVGLSKLNKLAEEVIAKYLQNLANGLAKDVEVKIDVVAE